MKLRYTLFMPPTRVISWSIARSPIGSGISTRPVNRRWSGIVSSMSVSSESAPHTLAMSPASSGVTPMCRHVRRSFGACQAAAPAAATLSTSTTSTTSAASALRSGADVPTLRTAVRRKEPLRRAATNRPSDSIAEMCPHVGCETLPTPESPLSQKTHSSCRSQSVWFVMEVGRRQGIARRVVVGVTPYDFGLEGGRAEERHDRRIVTWFEGSKAAGSPRHLVTPRPTAKLSGNTLC
mmetsp:Transcript_32790/g.99132  ORF Transcript_32790/g.99132 Transcript_32790/m.99132 type:complete len:237 (-) Transcript_32790:365-1075(-)